MLHFQVAAVSTFLDVKLWSKCQIKELILKLTKHMLDQISDSKIQFSIINYIFHHHRCQHTSLNSDTFLSSY